MAKLSKYQTLHKKLMSQTNNFFKLKDGKDIYDALSHGQNSYLRFDRIESSAMDPSWIKKIEEVIPDLNDIVSNPKRTIQTLSEVVEVEKAKKTSRESVQHLASHTQYVKSIDDEGNVTPSKILNIFNDDFFAIYENKFIATLVRRLFLFVEKRYQYIVTQATLRDVELLYFKNKTVIDGSEIEIETKIRYSKPALDNAADKLKDFLRRIEDVRKYLRFFAGSEFMRILRRERDVRNPILQTNIIRKNPKYRNCYHLWQFLNSYMESGVELKVEEKYSQMNEEQLAEINKVLTINFLALKGGDAPKEYSKPKIYRPRILKTYDDEMFDPGKKYAGPVQFVRVDEKYREYKEGLMDLNPHPTRAMAEYMKEEYKENKERKEETKQVDSLIKRSQQEYKKYLKEQDKLLIKEQEDLEMISDLAEQAIQEEQEEKLKAYRESLANGNADAFESPKETVLTEEELKQAERPETVYEPEEPVERKKKVVEEAKPVIDMSIFDEKEEQEDEVITEVVNEPEEEQPVVKKGRGGARPGAGRPRKYRPEEHAEEQPEEEVIEEPVSEETPVKKGRGGARPGAGRPRKVRPEEVTEQPVEVPQEEVVEEEVLEQPVKKQRGGARPGAGRPRKVVVIEAEPEPEPEPEEVVEEQPVKKQRGGWRPGAGRKPKNRELPAEPVEEIEEPVVIIKKQRGGARPGAGRKPKPLSERKPKGQWGGARPGAGRKPKPKSDVPVVKKQRGGYRPGAGRKPKPRPEVVEQPQVVETPKPVEKPKPVAKPKPSGKSKTERRLEKKAKIEEKKAKILNVKNTRTGKDFNRR